MIKITWKDDHYQPASVINVNKKAWSWLINNLSTVVDDKSRVRRFSSPIERRGSMITSGFGLSLMLATSPLFLLSPHNGENMFSWQIERFRPNERKHDHDISLLMNRLVWWLDFASKRVSVATSPILSAFDRNLPLFSHASEVSFTWSLFRMKRILIKECVTIIVCLFPPWSSFREHLKSRKHDQHKSWSCFRSVCVHSLLKKQAMMPEAWSSIKTRVTLYVSTWLFHCHRW